MVRSSLNSLFTSYTPDLELKKPVTERNFTYWGMNSCSGLYVIWLEHYASCNSLSFGLSNTHCTLALSIKEKNVVKNQNGVTVVWAFKAKLGGHCECGFRHVPASLRTWLFWTVSDSRTPPTVLEAIPAGSYQLPPYGHKFSPCNYASISDPNQFLLLTSTLASCTLTSCSCLLLKRASLVAQLVKNLLAMREIPVQFLGWEDLLEKG